MKSFLSIIILLLHIVANVKSQSLLQAISNYTQLSNFTALLRDNPGLAGALLTSNASALTTKVTVLVPDNSAFTKLSVLYNVSMSRLSIQQLEPYLLYHLLVGQVLGQNLTVQQGITVPTFLTGPTFNNRSAGQGLGSTGADGDIHNGQVVFLQAKTSGMSASVKKFAVRQLQNPTVNAQGGLGHQINLTAVDGVFDQGYFQIVDKFLSLPLNCTESIRRWNMTSFRQSLNRTGLGVPLDITQNVTCFTPNDQAFLQAGSPQVTANITDLDRLVKFHIAVQPLYSNFLQDGQEFTTFSNETIRISIRGQDIFVNDAKIINKNVMTNNGLMHVLDRVMSPLNSNSSSITTQAPSSTRSSAPLDTVQASTTATASSSGTSSVNMAIPQMGPSSPFWTVLLALVGLLW